MEDSLGNKIRFFRKRAGLSQFNLELAIGASAGMISRIENGQVNPSKETLNRISLALELNKREVDYLVGISAKPVSEEAVYSAQKEIKDYFNRSNVFGYMICDRQRVWAISEGFVNMFSSEVSNTEYLRNKILGSQLLRVMFDPQFEVIDVLRNGSFEEMARYNLARFYKELFFMVDDLQIQDTIKFFERDPSVSGIWDSIVKGDFPNLSELDSRLVVFKILGMNIKLRYSRDFLTTNPRFEVIEYVPSNRLLRLVQNVTQSIDVKK